MIKQYFTQAWAQLRQQPMISAVSIAGTALAIFLIMLVVMMQQVKVAPFAPESNRDRFLHVHYMSITNKSWGEGNSSNGPMGIKTALECFKSLKTPEAVTIYTCMVISTPVNLPGQPATGIDLLQTDDTFWRVFDFSFVAGKPYDQATFDAGLPVAVITESVARRLFQTTEAVGREFLLNHAPYTVSGVVKDVSTLANTAYAQVWVPYTSTEITKSTWSDEHMGMMSVTILAKSRDDFPAIFSRLLSEGILLLAIVTPVALLIDYNLAHLELNSWRNGTTLEWDRLLLCAAISFVLITLMIVIGIGIPARKAMKVQPAEALHDE